MVAYSPRSFNRLLFIAWCAQAKLFLAVDWLPQNYLVADGLDAMMLRVEIHDKNGVLVPTASNHVTFHVDGPGAVIGVGNGDPSSHESDKASQRHAFSGLARCIVQSTETAKGDSLTVTARAEGLASHSVVVSVKQRH